MKTTQTSLSLSTLQFVVFPYSYDFHLSSRFVIYADRWHIYLKLKEQSGGVEE